MNNTQIPKRYARALFGLAEEMNLIQTIEKDIQSLLAIYNTVPEFRNILRSPVIKPVLKKKVIASLFEKSVHTLSLKFIQLLIQQGREKFLFETAHEFISLCRIKEGVLEVELTSAAPLSDSTVKEVEAKIASLTGLKPLTTKKLNPALLGGFVVRFGDNTYDASLKSKITKIARDFQTNIYEKGL